MNDPFQIDWNEATKNLAFADEYVWSYFAADGHCYISNDRDGIPWLPFVATTLSGREMWYGGSNEAYTRIVIDMTNLDWRHSLRRRPNT